MASCLNYFTYKMRVSAINNFFKTKLDLTLKEFAQEGRFDDENDAIEFLEFHGIDVSNL